MKPKHTVLAALISCSALSFIGCSKVNNGILPAPTTGTFLKGADGPPLWLVNNVEVINSHQTGGLRVKPDNIQRITVLSPASDPNLISRYGPKAKMVL